MADKLKSEKLLMSAGASVYAPGEVLLEKGASGNYNLDVLQSGQYDILFSSAGAPGYGAKAGGYVIQAQGGTGAVFMGTVKLSKQRYSITLGAVLSGYGTAGNSANSSFGSYITLTGAGGGRDTANNNSTANSNGKIIINDNSIIVGTPLLQTDGIKGSRSEGFNIPYVGRVLSPLPAPLNSQYGFGGGTSTSDYGGGNPYIKITFKK